MPFKKFLFLFSQFYPANTVNTKVNQFSSHKSRLISYNNASQNFQLFCKLLLILLVLTSKTSLKAHRLKEKYIFATLIYFFLRCSFYLVVFVSFSLFLLWSLLENILLKKYQNLKSKILDFSYKINDKLTPPVLCDENPIYEYRMNQVVFSTKLYLACLPNGFSRFFAFTLCSGIRKNGSLSFYDKIILSKI